MIINMFGKEVCIRKEIVVLTLIIITAAIGTTGYMINRNRGLVVINSDMQQALEDTGIDNGNISGGTTGEQAEEQTVEQIKEAEELIKVYVVGCVKKEGIVTLKKGQLIDDAIKAAGGATPDADIRNINLVYELTENVMLRIRSKKETQPVQQSSKSSKPSTSPAKTGSGVQLVKDSGGAVATGSESESKSNGKININTATVSELDSLSGIGEATAKKIIDYREKNGGFKAPADIMKVSGIGQSKFSKIKDNITVE